MEFLIAFIIISIILFFILLLYCLGKASSAADQYAQQLFNQESKVFFVTCEKCNIEFSWTEQDVLIKKNQGATCIVACPKCGKLMKQHIK